MSSFFKQLLPEKNCVTNHNSKNRKKLILKKLRTQFHDGEILYLQYQFI